MSLASLVDALNFVLSKYQLITCTPEYFNLVTCKINGWVNGCIKKLSNLIICNSHCILKMRIKIQNFIKKKLLNRNVTMRPESFWRHIWLFITFAKHSILFTYHIILAPLYINVFFSQCKGKCWLQAGNPAFFTKFSLETKDIHIECFKQFKQTYTSICLSRAGHFGQC